MNGLGLVTSSYGEMMTKLYQNDTNGLFLPNVTLIRQEIQTGLGQLTASLHQFVINPDLKFRYLCEYIGEYKIQINTLYFSIFIQVIFVLMTLPTLMVNA